MWFLMFVACFTTGCELQAYPEAFKTEAECQSLIAKLHSIQKSEFLQAESSRASRLNSALFRAAEERFATGPQTRGGGGHR